MILCRNSLLLINYIINDVPVSFVFLTTEL